VTLRVKALERSISIISVTFIQVEPRN
jgi:hypothetical protein